MESSGGGEGEGASSGSMQSSSEEYEETNTSTPLQSHHDHRHHLHSSNFFLVKEQQQYPRAGHVMTSLTQLNTHTNNNSLTPPSVQTSPPPAYEYDRIKGGLQMQMMDVDPLLLANLFDGTTTTTTTTITSRSDNNFINRTGPSAGVGRGWSRSSVNIMGSSSAVNCTTTATAIADTAAAAAATTSSIINNNNHNHNHNHNHNEAPTPTPTPMPMPMLFNDIPASSSSNYSNDVVDQYPPYNTSTSTTTTTSNTISLLHHRLQQQEEEEEEEEEEEAAPPQISSHLVDSSTGQKTTTTQHKSGGRNPKKRTRASRRAPTTVLTTDTTNFRAMVQEFTGVPSPPFFGGGPTGSGSGLPSFSFFFPRTNLFGSSSSPTTHLFPPHNPNPHYASPPVNHMSRPVAQLPLLINNTCASVNIDNITGAGAGAGAGGGDFSLPWDQTGLLNIHHHQQQQQQQQAIGITNYTGGGSLLATADHSQLLGGFHQYGDGGCGIGIGICGRGGLPAVAEEARVLMSSTSRGSRDDHSTTADHATFINNPSLLLLPNTTNANANANANANDAGAASTTTAGGNGIGKLPWPCSSSD